MNELGGQNQSRIRAVIFDMDGVLTDSEPLINAAAIAMFREKGLLVQPEDFLPFVGTGEDRYIGGVAERYHFALDLPAAKARTYEIYLELVPTQLKAFPGAADLVLACRDAGLRVAVASSADRIKIEANLRQIGLPAESWDAVVVGEEVSNKKPAPDIFLTAAAKLGLSSDECVVLEDAVNGVDAAKAAGMRCVAVAQTFPAERLLKADLVRPSLREVSTADLLTSQNARRQMEVPPVIASVGLPSVAVAPDSATVRPWGLWATAGLMVVILGAGLLAQTVAAVAWILLHGPDASVLKESASNGFLVAIATCASGPVVLALAYLFAWIRRKGAARDYLGFRAFQPKALAIASLVLLAMIALSDALTVSLGKPLVPEFMTQAYRTAGFLPLLWLALIVIAPIAEEVVFRGFLFEGILHSRLGGIGAVVLTALIWSLIHLQYDLYGLGTIFVFGLFLGYVRLKTGSIYPTLFLHALMNLIATIEVAVLINVQR